MQRKTKLGLAVLLASCAQFGYAEITPMSESSLDRITAGSAGNHPGNQQSSESVQQSASGGAVVGNDSLATINSTGNVTLEGEAQSEARSLNMVNSSESTVANGLNIWQSQGDTAVAPPAVVEQANNVSQDQRRMAALPSYNRPEANVEESWDRTGASSSASTYDELDNVTSVESSSTSVSTTTSSSVDALSTVAGQNVQAGKGMAISGMVEAEMEGGSFEITGSGGVGDGAAEAELSVVLTLPAFSIDAEASGCAAMNGSCTAEGTTDRTEETLSDHSTEYSLSETSESSEEYTDMGSRLTRSAFEIEDALAEYIVVDNSELSVSTDYSVNLSGTAQASLRGMNVVNAAGSAVANGVNISRNEAGVSDLSLVQSNVIVHSR